MTDTHVADLTVVPWEVDKEDDYFTAPYVDLDEWRDAPVRHRYVHGGFDGTDTRFSFYLPEAREYEGRFYQHVTHVPLSENLAVSSDEGESKIAFSVHGGAYFVETNGGGPRAADPFSGLEPSIGAYRAHAAAARFSRQVAAAVYGEHRPYGYLFGGSGGAYRTLGASENTDGVWDGFVPFVPGSPMSIPNVFSVRMHAMRILRDAFPAIVDAYDVGGDPSALDLTAEQAAALDEVTRMGFPPRSWFGWETMGMHGFSVLYPGVMAADPTYAEDFWTVPGYLGADPTSSVHRDRVQVTSTVEELLREGSRSAGESAAGSVDQIFGTAGDDTVTGVRLSLDTGGSFHGAQLTVVDGPAAGAVIRVSRVDGDVVRFEPEQDEIVAQLQPGAQVAVDNSSFLAAQTYHRHQVPGPEYAVWDQFRDADGHPLYPQRPTLIGPLFTQAAAGTVPTGRVSGKVIVVAALLDREAFAWQADWLRQRVQDHLGSDASDRFRLWYVDNALHGDTGVQEFPDRTVSYLGALESALYQLAAWVERGEAPAATTTYSVVDGQVDIPDAVEERGGVQPVVRVTVDGSPSAEVRVGQPVVVRVETAAPAPGVVVEVRIAEDGKLGDPLPLDPASTVELTVERTFDRAGTYFVAARVVAQAQGVATSPHARVQNIARARVTVVE